MEKRDVRISNSMQDKSSKTSPASNSNRIIVSAINTNCKIMEGRVVDNKK